MKLSAYRFQDIDMKQKEIQIRDLLDLRARTIEKSKKDSIMNRYKMAKVIKERALLEDELVKLKTEKELHEVFICQLIYSVKMI